MKKKQLHKLVLTEIVKYELTKKLHEDEVARGGLADGMTIGDIARRHQISIKDLIEKVKYGMKIEREHTLNDDLAFEIALDHLYEDPDYYSDEKRSERKNRLI